MNDNKERFITMLDEVIKDISALKLNIEKENIKIDKTQDLLVYETVLNTLKSICQCCYCGAYGRIDKKCPMCSNIL